MLLGNSRMNKSYNLRFLAHIYLDKSNTKPLIPIMVTPAWMHNSCIKYRGQETTVMEVKAQVCIYACHVISSQRSVNDKEKIS